MTTGNGNSITYSQSMNVTPRPGRSKMPSGERRITIVIPEHVTWYVYQLRQKQLCTVCRRTYPKGTAMFEAHGVDHRLLWLLSRVCGPCAGFEAEAVALAGQQEASL